MAFLLLIKGLRFRNTHSRVPLCRNILKTTSTVSNFADKKTVADGPSNEVMVLEALTEKKH